MAAQSGLTIARLQMLGPLEHGFVSSGSPGRSWLERLSLALSGEPRDQSELIELIRDAQQRNLIDADALKMIEGVMQVDQMQVRDVMIPRAQMVVVKAGWDMDRTLSAVVESGHSRLPVVGEDRDEVLGILLAKDLLRHIAQHPGEPLLREVKFIPESKRLDVLLSEFRANRLHMAIVVDEYGGTAGLVTIEDVLEQIVGEIDDEHDDEDPVPIRRQGDGSWLVKALTPIEDFNEFFDDQVSDDEYDTIGGLVLHAFGRMPRRGEEVNVGPYHFRVLRADNRRIYLLNMTLQPQEEEETQAEA